MPADVRLRLAGALLLVAAVVAPVLLPALAPFGTGGPETYVDGDDVAVTVPTTDRTTMLWSSEASTEPTCTVLTPDGAPLPLTEVADGPRRDGKAGDDVGRRTFEPGARSAVVTCTGATGVLVTPEPHAVSGWAAVALVGGVVLVLATAGLGCLAVASRSRPAVARARSRAGSTT